MSNIFTFFRLLMAAFLLYAGAQQALAQQVLLLTTNVTGANAEPADGIESFNYLQQEFANALADPDDLTRMSVLGNAGAISQDTFNPASGPYDIVIVLSTYRAIHASNWAVIQQAVANRWANTILFFIDGCCEAQNGRNAATLVSTLNAAAQSAFAIGRFQANMAGFPLNTNSPLARSFNALNPLYGGYVTYINNVPANNALYLAAGEVNFPPAGSQPVNNVFGLLIPTAQSNRGAGACVFAVVDATIFSSLNPNRPDNQGKIAPAFFNAATAEDGACGLPKVSKSFDKSDFHLGDISPTLLTISLSNATPNDIRHVSLTDNLPAPLVVGAGAVTNTCTAGDLRAAVGSDSISDASFTIPSGGCSITVPVSWPHTDAGRQACISDSLVTNTITPGTDFVSPTGQVNTPATASLTCRTGQLTLSKQVVWPANVTPVDLTGTSFPVSVACTGTDGVTPPIIDTLITLTTPDTGSTTIDPLIASGSCVVTETSRPEPPANHLWVEDPPPSVTVSMQPPPADTIAQLINTLARANTDITISKKVAGGPAEGFSGAFNFTANCGIDGSFDASVVLAGSSAGAIAIQDVPVGASCTISQNSERPTPPASYSWDESPLEPVNLVTEPTGNMASFVSNLVLKETPLPAAVPTLREWGLLMVSLMLVMLGARQIQRRQR